jgi:hypothetical protein
VNTTTYASVAEDGQAVYENQLKAELEPEHEGEFVAIEPGTPRYFLGKTATAALSAAHKAMPQSLFFLTRVGSTSAHRIGGHASRIR